MTLCDYIYGKSPFHLVIFIRTIVICSANLRNNRSPAPDKTQITAERDKIKFFIRSPDSSTISNLQQLLGKNPDSYDR
jgi:hypothetical protein